MTEAFEVRERSFFVTGDMTDFDEAAVRDYLGKLGLNVVDKQLPLPQMSPDLLEFELAPREEVFLREEFLEQYRGRGVGNIWNGVVKAARENRLPLDLRRTEVEGGVELGITYQSAVALLELLNSDEYKGYKPTMQAMHSLNWLVHKWSKAQETTEAN